ncbi:tyrosine-protein phosphatase [Desertivirga xinjiangensis]|uniref:tyrosine-protein phosphatase n=1 Tax=Desertivirga xinjiangensis TaxID=539206 RepID=UPI00210B3927|nr:CpsB/CapC family capsule biosynthesis tyrosine phosphatase [Pedobacter xinjiangensis]
MHSHLIPGVDDGAENMEDSLSMIEALAELGFNRLFTTPHSMQGLHPNTKSTLVTGYQLIKSKLPNGITLELSSEYYLDEHFDHLVNTQQLLLLPGQRLLIEFSQVIRPYALEESLFGLAIKGYQVVLAHPERYLFLHKNFDDYFRLKDMGVEFQVNALSLTDHYGKNIRAIAEKLTDHKLVDFIGTDIHRIQQIDLLKKVPSSRYYAKLLESGLLKNNSLSL